MNELDKVKANLADNAQRNVVSFESTVASAMRKVYLWMTFALIISGLSAWLVASNETYFAALMGNNILFWGLIITEIVLVFVISAAINRLSPLVATLLFILYSIVNGVTLSYIFVVYELSSVASIFFITAGTFAAMAVIGYTTKKDLTSFGRFLWMALIGLIIALVVNIFLKSGVMATIISAVGVLIFVGLTAYDTQVIKGMIQNANGNEELLNKIGIIGALTLYLDFINIFLHLLELFGKSSD